MIGVSFAMTAEAFADRTKTETRRFWKPQHAAKFKPGTIFMGWTKDPRAGGVRMHPARVVACYRERLSMMSGYSFSAEGGTRYWPDRAAHAGDPQRHSRVSEVTIRDSHRPMQIIRIHREPTEHSWSRGRRTFGKTALGKLLAEALA
jgi:hypothetical protein